MAEDLEIGRHWFHKGKLAHYDIPKSRMKELMDLCELVSSKDIVHIIKGSFQQKNSG
jgi:hypothetical protein